MRVKDGREERRLWARRELYVGIRRDWARGPVVFVKRVQAAGDDATRSSNSSNTAAATTIAAVSDMVIGLGIFERTVELDSLADEQERRLCVENNWYGKLVFSQVAVFMPPVPVAAATPLASKPAALLHGLAVDDVQAIERLARSRLIV